MSEIRRVDPGQYLVPMTGGPQHRNLEWWATKDEVLGVLILDTFDNDYSWVVLTVRPTVGYAAIDLGHSHPTKTGAREALHAAMLKADPGMTIEPDDPMPVIRL